MRGKWLLAGATVVLLAIAAGALSLLRDSQEPKVPARKTADTAGAALLTEVTLSGKVYAQHVVPVGAPIEGTIEELFAEAGDEVYEGQLLARIRNVNLITSRDQAAAEVERAETRIANLESGIIASRLEASRAAADASRARGEFESAERTFQRQEVLLREGATPRLVFEKAQKAFNLSQREFQSLDAVAKQADERIASMVRELDAARRVLDEKNIQLEHANSDLLATQIHAPVDGVVVGHRAEPGQEVTREIQDLFRIAVDLTLLQVEVEPDPPALNRIQPGQEAVIRIAELASEALPAAVKEIKGNHVIVEFVSPDPAIRPGLTALVIIKLT